MKNLFKIILLLLLFTINAEAQTVTWQKWYDFGQYYNEGEDVIQTIDGGYLFLGINYSSPANGSFLTKTNEFGLIEWQRLINVTVLAPLGLLSYSVEETDDSGFLISGFGGDSAYLIRTDSYGNVEWFKGYTKPGADATFYDHTITLDGGIIACGELYQLSTNTFQGWIVKTDNKGSIEWDTTFKDIGTFERVIQAKDSNYYLGSRYGISKVNKFGKLIWAKNVAHGGPFVTENDEGYIFLGGSVGIANMFLNKLDTSGKIIWEKNYYPGARCDCMCLSKEGNILMAGYIDSIVQGIIAVTKVDAEGNLIYNKQIFSASGNNLSFLPYSVKHTSDYGFIMTGFTNYPRFTSYRDNVLAVKTDSTCSTPSMVGINENITFLPSEFILFQNYPNPFNPSTTIKYELSKRGKVNIEIFNINGLYVCNLLNKYQSAGIYEILFNTQQYNLSSGIYYLKFNLNNLTETKKILLLK